MPCTPVPTMPCTPVPTMPWMPVPTMPCTPVPTMPWTPVPTMPCMPVPTMPEMPILEVEPTVVREREASLRSLSVAVQAPETSRARIAPLASSLPKIRATEDPQTVNAAATSLPTNTCRPPTATTPVGSETACTSPSAKAKSVAVAPGGNKARNSARPFPTVRGIADLLNILIAPLSPVFPDT